ncbi:MAG: hypothetical protein HIU81_08725 [Acidobacteria bacterium]|nr:hypothetical protein [Acidobacteriota bacterium]
MYRVLSAPQLGWRLARLGVGLFAYGWAIALMVRGSIGLSPWDVFGQGIAKTTHISFGTATIVISFVVLLFWIPLRQRPGIGTLANAVCIGLFVDLGLSVLPAEADLWVRVPEFALGLVLLAFATALYIGAGLGPGPRDGLMTGLVRRTHRPVWLIRTGLEASVVVIGFVLGGDVGVGTVVFAVGVGPLTQIALRWLRVDLHAQHSVRRQAIPIVDGAPVPPVTQVSESA